jgi:hypothetical protein
VLQAPGFDHRPQEPPVNRRLLFFAALALALTAAACVDDRPSQPVIRLVPGQAINGAAIHVDGLSASALGALRADAPSDAEWTALLRVDVRGDAGGVSGLPPVAGTYAVERNAVVFKPLFGLDPGMEYRATFNGALLPAGRPSSGAPIVETLSVPRIDRSPTAVVSRVYPTSEIVPENLLRLYVQFSVPMGRKGGIEYLTLLDGRGDPVEDPFLPLDAEFWNGDRTRFTVFLDPGRVKRGVRPNEDLGRSLEIGEKYTLVVSREWPDAYGSPLKEEFRRTFRAGSADEQPLSPLSTWRIAAPRGGTADVLQVNFPEALDHGLLLRAVGVETSAGQPVEGTITIDLDEKRWSLAPATAWRAGEYRLVVLNFLEDASGNRLGRAFEVDQFSEADRDNQPERATLAFRIP